MTKLRAVEAQERLERPPLTDIKARVHLYAEEVESDIETVIFIEFPSNNIGSFGGVLSRAELLGTLAQVMSDIATSSDDEIDRVNKDVS